jgi:hypothetical protein
MHIDEQQIVRVIRLPTLRSQPAINSPEETVSREQKLMIYFKLVKMKSNTFRISAKLW